jgi:hypothetical protein
MASLTRRRSRASVPFGWSKAAFRLQVVTLGYSLRGLELRGLPGPFYNSKINGAKGCKSIE